jgi:3-phenylpropionate/trans-cinnamate dioxygenase ferredoxin subunit
VSLVVSLDVSDLAPGQMRAIEEGGVKILVCHAEDRFYAIENRCPHAAVRLDAGALRGCVLECPVHGGKLDVRDGSPAGHPIRKPASTFPVTRVDDKIEILIA